MSYSSQHKGYCYVHLPSNKNYISHHVRFNETVFPFANLKPSSPILSLESPHTSILTIFPPTSLTTSSILPSSPTTPSSTPLLPSSPPPSHPIQTRQKTNSRKPKQFHNFQVYSAHTSSFPDADTEPSCYSQAIKHSHWRETMAQELDALAKNKLWELTDPPPNSHIIGCKWIFKVKKKADGTVLRYKARLVVKGYN
jgi:Reverse transcriptase (RNA-dependent DNA polymerase)